MTSGDLSPLHFTIERPRQNHQSIDSTRHHAGTIYQSSIGAAYFMGTCKFTQVNVLLFPVLIMYACALRMSCKCHAELQLLAIMGLKG